MIDSIDKLLGNTLEVRIITMIIPLGVGTTFTTKQIMNATGANKARVFRCLNKFREYKLLMHSTHQVLDTQPPEEWEKWTLLETNIYRAMYQMIHATYDDTLKAQARELIGRR
jgi:hypothetical protein